MKKLLIAIELADLFLSICHMIFWTFLIIVFLKNYAEFYNNSPNNLLSIMIYLGAMIVLTKVVFVSIKMNVLMDFYQLLLLNKKEKFISKKK